jgi:hypothetical protein
MSVTSQLSQGFRVSRCDQCGEQFWIKLETAEKLAVSGRNIQCRECIHNPLPYPFGRRLTDEERDEFAMEVRRNENEVKEETPIVTEAYRISKADIAEVSAILNFHLVSHSRDESTSYGGFAKACGISDPTLKSWLKNNFQRTPQQGVFDKIKAEIEKRGWTAPEPVVAEEELPFITGEPEKEPDSQQVSNLQKVVLGLANLEKAHVISCIMHYEHMNMVAKESLLNKLSSVLSFSDEEPAHS